MIKRLLSGVKLRKKRREGSTEFNEALRGFLLLSVSSGLLNALLHRKVGFLITDENLNL